ncbi:MAG: Hsp20/alpha crystallin family protein [Sulfuricurvum sp.]|uniref:Hsp20/alpha crystallin family protein n=1 Tax=Sulfuricurvum sp. TaxID=2025608 RepID=UPI002725280B|nr:Hsp20/alpha crystallin family protein [Sulfuricurvum sp.]MDO9055024.1 Hsp20/alpha crystallin family protein [Sulfuricurvum sp.]MDP3292810.1 Hsp20/alpha crystallin family protein [Sulfuricurvum sp.]
MTLSKRLLIALGAVPLLVSAAITSPQQKGDNPCEQGCPFWSIEEMENFFNRPTPRMSSMYSASRIKESNKAYLISIDLPGMDKKDISIETSGNKLVISGERKEESESKEGSKKSYRQFNQSFSLPDDANREAISATSANGVLKITVPKTGKKASKKIEIK